MSIELGIPTTCFEGDLFLRDSAASRTDLCKEARWILLEAGECSSFFTDFLQGTLSLV